MAACRWRSASSSSPSRRSSSAPASPRRCSTTSGPAGRRSSASPSPRSCCWSRGARACAGARAPICHRRAVRRDARRDERLHLRVVRPDPARHRGHDRVRRAARRRRSPARGGRSTWSGSCSPPPGSCCSPTAARAGASTPLGVLFALARGRRVGRVHRALAAHGPDLPGRERARDRDGGRRARRGAAGDRAGGRGAAAAGAAGRGRGGRARLLGAALLARDGGAAARCPRACSGS